MAGTGTHVGLILAAGASRRFGPGNKLLAPFRGRALASHAADAMRGAPLDARFAVVSDAGVAALFAGFRLLEVAPGGLQSQSLRRGVAAARAAGADGRGGLALVALADMPLVTSDLLAAVLARAAKTGAAAAADGARRGPPAAFGPGHLDALARVEGDRGAAALLRALPAAALVPAPGALADVDSAADISRLGGQ